MTTIKIERDHKLPVDACQQLSEEVADSLVSAYGGSKQISASEVTYTKGGSKGVLSYTESKFVVVVKLSFLMRPMAKMIESEIQRQFDKRL